MKENKKVKKFKNFKKPKVSQKASKKIVAVSGGFDPIHVGHIRLFQEAKKLGDELVVILNNDNWLRKKKGKEFMAEVERKEIIEAIGCVDRVVISSHSKDINFNNMEHKSVCTELKNIRPHIFANGGDRFADDIPEFKLCNELGIETIFNVGYGGKIRSSSELLKEYTKKTKKKKNDKNN